MAKRPDLRKAMQDVTRPAAEKKPAGVSPPQPEHDTRVLIAGRFPPPSGSN